MSQHSSDPGTVLQVEHGASVCADILASLPQWFGMPEANAAYVRDAAHYPTFAAYRDDRAVGMIVIKQHTAFAAEAAVLGVVPAFHRQGIGRQLFDCAEAWLLSRGVTYLTVKTLGACDADRHYRATRAFYAAMGFVPIEEFPTLWSPAHPCLLMLKTLPPPSSS